MHSTYFHYLVAGMLLAVYFYLGESAVSPMRSFDPTEHHGKAYLAVEVFSESAQSLFEKINKINFLAYFGLCASAIFIYTKTQDAWLFVVNVLVHFAGLCIAYFWVGDMLLVFQKQHNIWQGGFSGSLLIVPVKLLFAVIFAAVSLTLARSIVKSKHAA